MGWAVRPGVRTYAFVTPEAMAHSGEIGARIRETRERQGLSLQQLSDRSGGRLKPGALSGYERGDRQIAVGKLVEIAELLDVPVADLWPAVQGERFLSEVTRAAAAFDFAVAKAREAGLGEDAIRRAVQAANLDRPPR